jgi:hypothetical protein
MPVTGLTPDALERRRGEMPQRDVRVLRRDRLPHTIVIRSAEPFRYNREVTNRPENDRIVIDYDARAVSVAGEVYELAWTRADGYRVRHQCGFDVGTVRISEQGISSSSVIGELVVRAWLTHCAEDGLDPWPRSDG